MQVRSENDIHHLKLGKEQLQEAGGCARDTGLTGLNGLSGPTSFLSYSAEILELIIVLLRML